MNVWAWVMFGIGWVCGVSTTIIIGAILTSHRNELDD